MLEQGAAADGATPPPPQPPGGGGSILRAFRTEARKLARQTPTQVLALACLLGPPAFGAVLRLQGGVPGDALFGVWVHSSSFAVSLVILGFTGSWGFPLIAGVLAGDMFSSEDRYGTWKTLLTRSCSRGQVFVGKVLAAASFAIVMVAITAISSLIGGLIVTGDHALVSLSGTLLSPGAALGLLLVSWLLCVPAVLAFVGLAVLFSVVTRNGIMGVLGPLLVALVFQLLVLIGGGTVLHTLLISSSFDGWHGLFTAPRFYGPLAIGIVVSCVWLGACVGTAWRIMRGRDFAGPPVNRRPGWVMPLRVVLGSVVLLAVLAAASGWGPDAVTASRLTAALTPTFDNLSVLQQRELGRAIPAGAHLTIVPNCKRRAGASTGPGDWTCTLDVFIPQEGAIPFQQTAITYDVSVQSNGCYKAEAPPSFVGQQLMRAADGRTVENPVFTIYGCFNTL